MVCCEPVVKKQVHCGAARPPAASVTVSPIARARGGGAAAAPRRGPYLYISSIADSIYDVCARAHRGVGGLL